MKAAIPFLLFALFVTPAFARGDAPVLKPSSGGVGNATGDASGLSVKATGATTARTNASRAGDIVTPQDFGAYADLQQATKTVTASAGNCAISVSGGAFAASDVGKVFDSSGLGATYAVGGVASIAVASPGTGYTSAPTVAVSDGSGGAYQALMTVLSASIANGGSGYADGPQTLTVAGYVPGQALAVVVTASGGSITAVNSITTGGQYPQIPGTTAVSTTGGAGTGASLNLTWGVDSVLVISPGVNYPTSGAVASLSGGLGGGAAAAALTSGVSITSTLISQGGSGYSSAPSATFVGGDGTGATAGAVTVSGGAVTAVAISAGGTGYSVNPPTIIFSPAAPASPATLGAVAVTPAVDPLSTTIASVQSASQITLAACPLSASSGSQALAWGHDDTAAVQAALNSGSRVLLPGSLLVTDTVSLLNGTLTGQKSMSGGLYGSVAIPLTHPLLAVGRTSEVSTLGLHYVGPAITDRETQGQRVGFSTAGTYNLQRGSFVHNLEITHVGTGVYDGTATPFSVTFDTFEINDFSFRGWDFIAPKRTGNIYRNFYILTKRPNADRGFSLAGGESESRIDQINVEHSILNTAVYLGQIKGLSAGAFHLEGDQQRNPQTGFVKVEDTIGSIDVITMWNMRSALVSPMGVEIGSSTLPGSSTTSSWGGNRLRIGVIQAQGLNFPDQPTYPSYAQGGLTGVYNFSLIGRTPTAVGNYTLAVDSYEWRTYTSADAALYSAPVTNAAGRLAFERFASATSSGVVGNAPYSLQAPDSTVAGGNARGNYATDMQRMRTAATQVASGLNATLVGGANNIAGGNNSVSGGYFNIANGSSSVAFGQSNQVYGTASATPGGLSGTDRSNYGTWAFASGTNGALGDAQMTQHVLRASATGTTAVRLTADGAAAGSANCLNIPNNLSYAVNITLNAHDLTTAGKSYVASWGGGTVAPHLLTRGASAATTLFDGVTTPVSPDATRTLGTVTGVAASATADTTNGCLNLAFTPPSGNTDTWHVTACIGGGSCEAQ